MQKQRRPDGIDSGNLGARRVRRRRCALGLGQTRRRRDRRGRSGRGGAARISRRQCGTSASAHDRGAAQGADSAPLARRRERSNFSRLGMRGSDAGVLSLVLLAIACLALYGLKLSGASRWIYVLTAMVSLYLNVFVLIIQSFLKVGPLHALAPSVPPSEPPFAIAQGIVLVFFVIVIIGAVRRFRPV